MQTLADHRGQQLEVWCRVPELLAGLEVSPPLLESQQGQVWSEEGGTLELLRVGPFTIQNNHLSIFKKQNIHQGELQLKSSTPK